MANTIDIETVIKTLALPFDIREVDGNYTCPMCHRKKKLNINFQLGVYNCNYPTCEMHGSAFDLWAFYRGIKAADRKELCHLVAKDFYSYTGNGTRPAAHTAPERVKPSIQQFALAPEDVLDSTFSALLDGLSLSEKHKADLEKRGLLASVISENGYKSAPTVGSRQIAHRLLAAGHKTEGVPGFFKSKGSSWSFVNYGPGFLIPCRSVNGQIHGLQMRTDRKTYKKPSRSLHLKGSASALKNRLRCSNGTLKKRPKYLTLSTAGKPCGTKGITKPHFNPGKGGSEVVLTEGPLKGDIISYFTGLPCLAILGVDCISHLPQMLAELRAIGKTKILIAFDMDMYTNPNVERAFTNLRALICHMGFRFSKVEWNSAFKGYDDWLAR